MLAEVQKEHRQLIEGKLFHERQIHGSAAVFDLIDGMHIDMPPINIDKLRDEGFNFEALDDIENRRCCCANCNGDMRQHNMFSFLDVVGRFMVDEYARWRRWRYESL